MTAAEYRDQILRDVVRHYREMVRLENLLEGKKYLKTYKNPKCPSAKALSEDRREAIRCLVESWKWLMKSYHKLPEVQGEQALQGAFQAVSYAKQLAKPNRRPKYMKNQTSLA